MQVELRCPACLLNFHSHLDTAVIERISEEGPWGALGDGETFEDRLHASMMGHEQSCPRCGSEVTVTEESLGDLSSELLAQW